MAKVCVVIPYYQRTPGILARALRSVYAQELGPDVQVEILIVDDESPSPPEPELGGLNRANLALRIIKRPNGGPARARNTGLEACSGADFIAFLDSDDTWVPGHLQRAVEALGAGAQFYFANNWYDEDETWFSGLVNAEPLNAASTPLAENARVRVISCDALMPLLIEECLPHTSTVVFKSDAYDAPRFDQDQLIAGEDHLLWLSLADRADKVAFSEEPMAARGRGIDLYRAALNWDHPDCIRRLYFKLLLHKKIKQRFAPAGALGKRADRDITALRRGIVYLLIRNHARHGQQNGDVVRNLRAADPAFFWSLPINLIAVVLGKALGRFELPKG